MDLIEGRVVRMGTSTSISSISTAEDVVARFPTRRSISSKKKRWRSDLLRRLQRKHDHAMRNVLLVLLNELEEKNLEGRRQARHLIETISS
jgi:hypothetical protein